MRVDHCSDQRPFAPASRLLGVLLAAAALAPASWAQEPSHGEMAARIRAAGLPCARALEVVRSGEGTWRVRCNSGLFEVTERSDGSFDVTPRD
jgi:hypothetical protein